MEDADLIARIYPVGETNLLEELRHATSSITCNKRFREPRRPLAETEQTTPEDLSSLPFLELRFSDGPRAPGGFVFGKHPDTSDVVLPNLPGISRQHFALTYKNTFADGCYRLVIRDLGSLCGTTVTYDAQGEEHCRRKFDWIVAGFECPDLAKTIIVQPRKHVRFQIVVAPHDLTSPTYISNVERFLRGTGATAFDTGPHAELNIAARTPSDGPVLINRGIIARGRFGMVSRGWNVSTGEEYGCKKPTDSEYSRADWVKEISIMKRVDHKHIVRLCFSQTDPEPRLYLEYMPFGNLLDESKRESFTYAECTHILRQSLSALVYLHGQREPIAHRDLKPQNILVQSREPLHVKLGDFGFAKAGDLLTYCGTQTYAPPELQFTPSRQYTVAVDIWSLGVVILQFAYGLPEPGHGGERRWCEAIAEAAMSREPDGLIYILQGMLMLHADMRYSAAKCLGLVEALCEISGWNQIIAAGTVQENGSMSRPHGPTPYQNEMRAVSPLARSGHATDDQTIILERNSTRRHTRSGALSPAVRHPAQAPRQGLKSHGREHLPASGRIHKRHRRHSPAADGPGRDSNLTTLGNLLKRGGLEGLVQDLDQAASAAAQQADNKPKSPATPSAALPDALVRPSATWTRAVLFDRPGLARMVIRCCSISMRTSDHWLNASEIILASDLPEWKRRRYLVELNVRGFRAEGNLPVWVPFPDGVFVCQAAGLGGELEPLLSVPDLPRPAPEENYLLFLREQEQPDDRIEVFDAGGCTVAYQPARRCVNATHLCKLYGITRRSLSRFLSKHPHIDKQVRRGGLTDLRGTYISYEDARALCAHFRIDDGLLDRWIRPTSPGPGDDNNLGDDVDDAAAVAPLPAASSVLHPASPLPTPSRVSHPPDDAGEPAERGVHKHTSHYTEPSYSNGSYLIAVNQSSRLEPRNLRSLLTAPSTADSAPPGLSSGLGLSDTEGSGRWLAALESG